MNNSPRTVVIEASSGEGAVAPAKGRKADLVVIDIRMQGMDGLEALSEIKNSDVLAILLTSRAEETDRIIGLSIGADDYVTKPFSPREPAARVNAVLRRDRVGRA